MGETTTTAVQSPEVSWWWLVSPESTTSEHAEDVAKWGETDTRSVCWHIECKTNVFYINYQKRVKTHGNWKFVRVTGKDSSTKPSQPVRLLVSIKQSELQSSTDLNKKIRLRKRAFPLMETLYWDWQSLAFHPMNTKRKADDRTEEATMDLAFSFKIKRRDATLTRIKYHKNIIKPYYPILNATSQAHACVINMTDEEMRDKEEQDAYVPQISVEPRTHYVPLIEDPEVPLPPSPSKRDKMVKRLQLYEYPM